MALRGLSHVPLATPPVINLFHPALQMELDISSRALAEPSWATPVTSVAAASSEGPCPDAFSDAADSVYEEEEEDRRVATKASLINTIYAENRVGLSLLPSPRVHSFWCTS